MKVSKTLNDPDDIWADYVSVCSKVQYCTEIEGLFSALTRDVRSHGVDKIFSRLGATVKTHKPQGEQTLRALHKSVSTPFLPAMKFVCSYIAEFLNEIPHILKNSHQLKSKIENMLICSGDLFVKVDIKCFFMSGTHNALTDKCKPAFPPRTSDALSSLHHFILDNQFIVEGSELWKVLSGGGMGLTISGDTADMVFYTSVEKAFIIEKADP